MLNTFYLTSSACLGCSVCNALSQMSDNLVSLFNWLLLFPGSSPELVYLTLQPCDAGTTRCLYPVLFPPLMLVISDILSAHLILRYCCLLSSLHSPTKEITTLLTRCLMYMCLANSGNTFDTCQNERLMLLILQLLSFSMSLWERQNRLIKVITQQETTLRRKAV